MVPRWLPPVLVLLSLLAGGVLEFAFGQPPAVEGLERLTPEERTVVERNLERWRRLNPDERQRADDVRGADHEPYGGHPLVHAKGRILEDFQRWNELSAERREELQHAYDRFQRLPPERRERILQRQRQFQALPPEEKERVMRNFERWQRMTPEERRALRERQRGREGREPDQGGPPPR